MGEAEIFRFKINIMYFKKFVPLGLSYSIILKN